MSSESNTIIELESNHYAVVIDQNGIIREMYLPKEMNDDEIVPESISMIVDMIEEQKESREIRH